MSPDKLEISTTSKYVGKVQMNESFGYWKIIDVTAYITKNKRAGGIYFHCICSRCNHKKQFINVHALVKYRTNNAGGCISCSRKIYVPTGRNSSLWKGTGEIPMSYIHNIRNAAKRRNIEFDVSIGDLWTLFLDQNRICKISGIELQFSTRINLRDGTASLDRIDRTKPYRIGNIQWVHKDVNEMKWDKSDDELIRWCKIISEYNK